MNNLLDQLDKLYRDIGQPDAEDKTNLFILNSIEKLIVDTDMNKVRQYVNDNKAIIKDIINRKSASSFLYRQPVVLLIYFLIQYKREMLKAERPLPLSDIQPLFTDLGIALDYST